MRQVDAWIDETWAYLSSIKDRPRPEVRQSKSLIRKTKMKKYAAITKTILATKKNQIGSSNNSFVGI
jgi:hypothetical protein